MATKQEHLQQAVRVIRSGGIVGAATETFFGILADYRRRNASLRILAMKGLTRPAPISLIIPSMDYVGALAEDVPNLALLLMKTYWPGPLTLVLRARRNVPAHIKQDMGTIALRIPGPSDARDILVLFGGPLTAPSLNVHKKAPCITARQARDTLGDKLEMIVPGTSPGGLPSTIVDVTVTPPRVVRRGAIKVEGRFLR